MANFTYNGTNFPDMDKLRFQAYKIESEKDYRLSINLRDHYGSTYVLNEIWKETVGGLINKKDFTLCKEENCSYTLII